MSARTGRIFAIGDLHGCIDELDRLLDTLEPTAGDTVCCLGDYIDRGPSPRGVIDRLLRLRHEGPQCVFLKGNHEDMFLSFLGFPGHYGEAFLYNGGETTMASYGLQGVRGSEAAERLPADHLTFLRELEMQRTFGRYLCVHAGIRPTTALEEQDEEDLLWIREEFILSEHLFPVTVVFGHTPQREVLLHLPYKIGLDTGLVYWNKLSCLELTSRQLFQLDRGGTRVEQQPLDALLGAEHTD